MDPSNLLIQLFSLLETLSSLAAINKKSSQRKLRPYGGYRYVQNAVVGPNGGKKDARH